MESLLPSEIARLVLGYLLKEKSEAAAKSFLESSPHLAEYRRLIALGRKYPLKVNGLTLDEMLDEYCLFHEYVQEGYTKMVPSPSSSDQPKSLIDRLKHIMKSCQPVQVNISLCTRPEQSATGSSSRLDSSLSAQDSENQRQPVGPPLVQPILHECGSQEVSYSSALDNFQGLPICSPHTLHLPINNPTTQSLNASGNTGAKLPALENFGHYETSSQAHSNAEPSASSSQCVQQTPQSQDSCVRNVSNSQNYFSENPETSFSNISECNSRLEVLPNHGSGSATNVGYVAQSTPVYSVNECFGSNIIILDNSSQPSSSNTLPGSAGVQDGDQLKKVSSQEKFKLLMPSKHAAYPVKFEKINNAIQKNTKFIDKVVANINKVRQATPTKQSDAMSDNLDEQNEGQKEDDMDDIVKSALKETEEDPIFDSFLQEFLQMYDRSELSSNESSVDQQSLKKKKKKVSQRKSTEAVSDVLASTDMNKFDDQIPSHSQVDLISSESNARGMTPAKPTSEADTLTPISKLLKSITSPSNDLLMEPSPMADLGEVPQTKEDTHEQKEQDMQTITRTVPVILCNSSQEAAQYVNQDGVNTICQFQLIPSNKSFVSIAPKVQTSDSLKVPAFVPPPSEPNSKARKRCITRGGRLGSGLTRVKPKVTSSTEPSTLTDSEQALHASIGTVTMYSASHEEQSETVTLTYSPSLPLLTDDVSTSNEENACGKQEKLPACEQESNISNVNLSLSVHEESEKSESTSQHNMNEEEKPVLAVEAEKLGGHSSLSDSCKLRQTPGMQFIKTTKDKRQSMSTPRRRRSHIRALDFNTPPKDISHCSRKANTSPKMSSLNSKSPVTVAKSVKSSHRNFLKSHSEGGIRTSKVKAHLFKSPEYPLTSSSGFKSVCAASATTVSSSISSPKPSAAWDTVSGYGLILEKAPHSSPEEKQLSKPTSKKPWDSELRCLLENCSEDSSKPKEPAVKRPKQAAVKQLKQPAVKRKKKCSPSKVNANIPSKKRVKKEPVDKQECKDSDDAQKESSIIQTMNVSQSSDCDLAKLIEENLINTSVEKESNPGDDVPNDKVHQEKSSTQPNAHSSPVKSSAVTSPKSYNMLDIEANIKAYCIEREQKIAHCEESISDESFASSVQSKNAGADKSKPQSDETEKCSNTSEPTVSQDDSVPPSSHLLKPQLSHTKSNKDNEEDAASPKMSEEAATKPVENEVSNKDLQSLAEEQSFEKPIQQSEAVQQLERVVPSIFDTPVKESIGMVPVTPRFVDSSVGAVEDTPRTKIIKAHPPPPVLSAENSVQSPTLPPTPKMPNCIPVSPNSSEYFHASAFDNATFSECLNPASDLDLTNENLENTLIKEAVRLENDKSDLENTLIKEAVRLENDKNDLENTLINEAVCLENDKSILENTHKEAVHLENDRNIVEKRTNELGEEEELVGETNSKKTADCGNDDKNDLGSESSYKNKETVMLSVQNNMGNSNTDSRNGNSSDMENEIDKSLSEAKIVEPCSKDKSPVKLLTQENVEEESCGCARVCVYSPSRHRKTQASDKEQKSSLIKEDFSCVKGIATSSNDLDVSLLLSPRIITNIGSDEIEQALDKLHGKNGKLSKKVLCPASKGIASMDKLKPSLSTGASSSQRKKGIQKKALQGKEASPATAIEAVDSLFKSAHNVTKLKSPAKQPVKKETVVKTPAKKEAVTEASKDILLREENKTSSSSESSSSDSSSSDSSSESSSDDEGSLNRSAPQSMSNTSLPKSTTKDNAESTPSLQDAHISSCSGLEFVASNANSLPKLVLSELENLKVGDESNLNTQDSQSCRLPVQSDENFSKDVEKSTSREIGANEPQLGGLEGNITEGAIIPFNKDKNQAIKAEVNHMKKGLIKLVKKAYKTQSFNLQSSPNSRPIESQECQRILNKKIPDSSAPTKEQENFNPIQADNASEIIDDEEDIRLTYSCDEKEDACSENSAEIYSSVEKAVALIHADNGSASGALTVVQSEIGAGDVAQCKTNHQSSQQTMANSSGDESLKDRNSASQSVEEGPSKCIRKSGKPTISSSLADKTLQMVLEEGLGSKVPFPPRDKIPKVAPNNSVPKIVVQKSILDTETRVNQNKKPEISKHSPKSPCAKRNTLSYERRRKCEFRSPEDTSIRKQHTYEPPSGRGSLEIKSGEWSDGSKLEVKEKRRENFEFEGSRDKCYETVISKSNNTLELKLTYLGLGRKRPQMNITVPASIVLEVDDNACTFTSGPMVDLFEFIPENVNLSRATRDSPRKCDIRPTGREQIEDRGKHSRSGGGRAKNYRKSDARDRSRSSGSDQNDKRISHRDRSRPQSCRSPLKYSYHRHHSRDQYNSSDKPSGSRGYYEPKKPDIHTFRKSRELRSSTYQDSKAKRRSDAEEGEVISSDEEKKKSDLRQARPFINRVRGDQNHKAPDREQKNPFFRREILEKINSPLVKENCGSNNNKLHSTEDPESRQCEKQLSTEAKPEKISSSRLNSVEYSDKDLDRDLQCYNVLGNVEVEDSPSIEPNSDMVQNKQLHLRRAPPRSVNARKLNEQISVNVQKKRKASNCLETAETSQNSSPVAECTDAKRQRTSPLKGRKSTQPSQKSAKLN